MGMDLCAKNRYFRWKGSLWHGVLTIGLHYGWEPTGTGPPRGTLKANWSGYYGSNDGALFYARDAAALADALEQALPKLPKRQPKELKEISYYSWFISPEGKSEVANFIKFLRKGSFRIH